MYNVYFPFPYPRKNPDFSAAHFDFRLFFSLFRRIIYGYRPGGKKMKRTLQSEKSEKKSALSLLIVVMMTSFLTTFTGSALNLSVPAISGEFHAGAVSIGWIITGYILASAALSVPFGRLADLYGKKKVLVAGQISFTACAFLCSFAWNIETIVAFRLVQGIGAAMIFATNTAILVAFFPPEKRGKMLGLSVSATYAGLSLGPVIGGVMNHHFGWRSIFYITAALAAAAAFLAVFRLKEPAETTQDMPVRQKNGQTGPAPAEKKRMDLPGCLFYSAMLACMMYGLSSFTSGILPKILFFSGILLFFLFLHREKNTEEPLVSLDLFRKNTVFSYSNIAALLNYGASYAVSYLLSIYLQTVSGLDSQTAGLILITSPVFQTILSPMAGRLSDRFSPFLLSSCGMGISAAGIFAFIFISENYPPALIIGALAVIGIGFALFSSPNTNAIMSSVEKKDYSIASSVTATSRSIGHTLSMAVVTTVVALTIGNSTLEEAPHSSVLYAMRISFIIFTVFCAAGIFFSAKRKEQKS